MNRELTEFVAAQISDAGGDFETAAQAGERVGNLVVGGIWWCGKYNFPGSPAPKGRCLWGMDSHNAKRHDCGHAHVLKIS